MTTKEKENSSGENINPVRAGEVGAGWTPEKELLIDRLWKAGVIGILFILLFREELLRLVNQWRSPREMHGFLIPLFSLYFLYQERERLGRARGVCSFWGGVLILLSLGGYLFFFFTGFSYPRTVMMIGVLGGVVLLLGGWPIVRLTWLPIVFLLFAIPLPAFIHTKIATPMRKLASMVAAVILNTFPDLQAEAAGVVIYLTHKGVKLEPLNVADACSGMRLLRAFVALGVAMAYLEYRPIVHRVILLCSTIPIAILCNMVRVLLTGLIHVYIGREYTTGTPHTILGMSMLILAFGLYGLLAWIMNRIYLEEEEDKGDILVV